MSYSTDTRTALRTAARLGILFYAAAALFPLVWVAYYSVSPLTQFHVSAPLLAMTFFGPLFAVIAFRASRTEKHRRTALVAVWLMVAASVIWSGTAAALNFASAADGPPAVDAWGNVINILWPVLLAAYLHNSYRGEQPPQVEENDAPHDKPWWYVAVLLLVVTAGAGVLDATLFVGAPAQLAGMLIAGLAYRWMRSRHPLAGAADWRTVTVLICVPFLPAFVFDLVSGVHQAPPAMWFTVPRMALATATTIGFAGLLTSVLRGRRTRIGSPTP